MGEPQWTTEQQAAIDLRGQLLVAAAAGSGKTAVLVERLVRRITDPRERVDVDRFLVVTFTKAAANEMRERIGKALDDALFKEADAAEVERLLHQRSLLYRASITTLHSFCMELLRQNFYRLELDPAFRVADQAEADLLRQDIVEDLFEACYGRENESFQSLVEAFGSDRDDQPLMENVLRLYEFAISQIHPEKWLENLAQAYLWQEPEVLTRSPWGEAVRQGVNDKVDECVALLERAYQLGIEPGGPQHYAVCLQEDLARLQLLARTLEDSSWEEIETHFQAAAAFPKLPSGPRKGKTSTSPKKTADTPNTVLKSSQTEISDEIRNALREESKKARDDAKKKLEKLHKELFQLSLKDQIPKLREMGQLVQSLAEVVQEFSQEYARAKRQRNMVDFSDLEHFALKLLEENEEPTPVALTLQERFAEVLVDEYQDINPVQERILQLVSRQEGTNPNLFMVGDVKQSIYRFRMADPSLFLEKYSGLPHWQPGQTTTPEQKLVVDLNRNFRSRREVIQGVNFLFRQIMTPGAGEIPYDDQAALVYGASFINGDGELKTAEGPIEVHLFDPKTLQVNNAAFSENSPEGSSGEFSDSSFESSTEGITEENSIEEGQSNEELTLEDLEAARLEARLVAHRIQAIVQGREFRIYDKLLRDFRPAQYSDIVLLMRSFSSIAPLYVEEFQAIGIPVYAETSTGYFGASEVETILSLLKVIDNPRLNIPLAAVLRSPFVGMDGTELGKLRSLLPQGDFYEAFVLAYWATLDPMDSEKDHGIKEILSIYSSSWPQLLSQARTLLEMSPSLRDKVSHFYPNLQVWRQVAQRTSLADLLWRLYEETGYLAYVGTLPSGPQRQANLRVLYDRACRFEATNYRGLFRFLRFLDRFQNQGKDLGSARTLGENEDVVRLITVHASKGLEFPIVFVVGLGTKFNTRSLSGKLLLHSKLGAGIPLIDIENRVRYPSFIQTAVKERLWQESLAEELRILYVALTRAKERLFLYGALPKIEDAIKKWQNIARSCSKPTFPDGQLRSAKNFFDWIGPALARHPQNLFSASKVDSSPFPILDDSSHWIVQLHQSLEIAPSLKASTEKNDIDHLAEISEVLSNTLPESLSDVPVSPIIDWHQAVEERLGWVYPYPEAVSQVSKTSVSELKRRFSYHTEYPSVEKANQAERFNPSSLFEKGKEPQKPSTDYARPKFLQQNTPQALTPAERGIAFHSVMEHLPLQAWRETWIQLSRGEQEGTLESFLLSLLNKEILNFEQLESLSRNQIINFLNSPIGLRLMTADEVRREVPFTLSIFPPLSEGILVQGVIDALILSPDRKSAEIIDFKTDHLKNDEFADKILTERYAMQLALYTQAVERLLHVRVEQCTIYAVALNREICIPSEEIRTKLKALHF